MARSVRVDLSEVHFAFSFEERADFSQVESELTRILGRIPSHRETIRVLVAAWQQLKVNRSERAVVQSVLGPPTSAYAR